MSNARTGKIARASFETRTSVNEMLRDGATAGAIITFLESKDVFGVNETNVTNWRQGGHQDWLKEQQRLSEIQAEAEFATELVRKNEGHMIGQAAEIMAASQLFNVIREFDLSNLKELLSDKPENYARIVTALSGVAKNQLDLRKYQDAVSKARAEIQKLRDPKQALSDEDRKAIVDKVDEVLGIK